MMILLQNLKLQNLSYSTIIFTGHYPLPILYCQNSAVLFHDKSLGTAVGQGLPHCASSIKLEFRGRRNSSHCKRETF